MKGPRWTPEEDALLRQLYGKVPVPQVVRLLGRSRNSIAGRAGALSLRCRKSPEWTDAETDFLRRNHGRLTERQIARILGRTYTAVRIRSKKLALGRGRCAGAFMMHEAMVLLGVDHHVINRWIDLGWLYAERRITKAKPVVTLIKPGDLLDCLESHQDAWNAQRCPGLWNAIRNKRSEMRYESNHGSNQPGAATNSDESASVEPLSAEPQWLVEKRRRDEKLPPREGMRWTRREDGELLGLVAAGVTQAKIGEQLGRSHEAIGHRLYRLARRRRRLEEAAS